MYYYVPDHDLYDIFPKQLWEVLPLKYTIDHHINLMPGLSPISIPLYCLSLSEEDHDALQLKEYLKMLLLCPQFWIVF